MIHAADVESDSELSQISLTNQHHILQTRPIAQRKRNKRRNEDEEDEEEDGNEDEIHRRKTPKLTINDKVKIIYLSKNELKSYTEIGEIFRCTKSTISVIIKNHAEILEKASKMTETQSRQKCRVSQKSQYPLVEHSLFQWLNHLSVKGHKVSDKQIRERAREECFRIYSRDWRPSNGWLIGFKARIKRKELQNLTLNEDGTELRDESEPRGIAKWVEKIRDKTLANRPANAYVPHPLLSQDLQHQGFAFPSSSI